MENGHAKAADCPAPAELAAFVTGNLAGPAFERLAQHVEQCRACDAVLATLDASTDSFLTEQRWAVGGAINNGGPYESARNAMMALDFATQAQQMKVISGQPDYALGSVHAVTRDGVLVIASASGSQFASYAWGAANVIYVVGAQKLVPTLEAARERIYQHTLKLEDARAQAAYGQHSYVGKVLEVHGDLPGRVHIVLIRQVVGF